MPLSSLAALLPSLREFNLCRFNLRESQFREPRSQELSPRLPSLQPLIMAMLCLPVLTALVSTPSLTLLTPLMHNSLLSHSNLLHLPSDNPSNLPSLLSDNLLPPLFLNNNPSSLSNPFSPSNPSNPSNPSSHNNPSSLNKPSNPSNPSNPNNPSKHNSNSQSNLPSFSKPSNPSNPSNPSKH